MREIDKLLAEIPLDELLGETESETLVTAKPIILESSDNEGESITRDSARVKPHRAGIFTAAAAALALAAGGGLYFGITQGKLNPFSFLSKNGISESVEVEVQNRSLMEQAVEKRGGDPKLFGDRMVAFAYPVAPENYLGSDSDKFTPDFQIIGYTYSGHLANVFMCEQNRYALEKELQTDIDEETELYMSDYELREHEIKKAIDAGDYQRAKELIEINGTVSEDLRQIDSLPPFDAGDEFCSYALYNSDGEILYDSMSYGTMYGETVGDYYVWCVSVNMDDVADNTITLKGEYGGKTLSDLSFTLDKYKREKLATFECNTPTVIAFDKNEPYTARIKSISCGLLYTEVSLEADRELSSPDVDLDNYYYSYTNTEDGSMFMSSAVTPVYSGNSSPFGSLSPTVMHNGRDIVIRISYPVSPLDMSRIESFIIGTARVYVSGENSYAYGVINTPARTVDASTGRATDDVVDYDSNLTDDRYFFLKSVGDVKVYLENIVSTHDEVTSLDVDAKLAQSEVVTLYNVDGEIDHVAYRVNLLDGYSDFDGAYKEHLNTLYIDGLYYKLTYDECETFMSTIEKIKTSVRNGEEQ